jgi:hypothetical protein
MNQSVELFGFVKSISASHIHMHIRIEGETEELLFIIRKNRRKQ